MSLSGRKFHDVLFKETTQKTAGNDEEEISTFCAKEFLNIQKPTTTQFLKMLIDFIFPL